jgi:hypothetical protein
MAVKPPITEFPPLLPAAGKLGLVAPSPTVILTPVPLVTGNDLLKIIPPPPPPPPQCEPPEPPPATIRTSTVPVNVGVNVWAPVAVNICVM